MVRIEYLAGLIAVAGCLLTGCASMNKAECSVANWRQIGYVDGTQGTPESRFAEHQSACAKHGFAADLGTYRAGRIEGLRSYCEPGRGFQEGINGNTYHGVCPPHLAPQFLTAYSDGKQVHDLRERVEDVADDMERMADRMRNIEEQSFDVEQRLRDPALTQEERDRLVDKLRDFRREYQDLQNDRLRLQTDLSTARFALSQEEARILPAYGMPVGTTRFTTYP
ncbi:MAG: DUF2799 domain-containing protein [Alphaproteobacteria bacterium]